MDDRREHPRLEAILLVEFGTDAFPLKEGETENISKGGLFIVTDETLERGDLIPIRINLPDDPTPIMADVQVAWVRRRTQQKKPGMGVAFVEIADEDLEKLNSLAMVMGDFLNTD